MDLFEASRAYVGRLLPSDGRAKVLLLDEWTVQVLSLAATQSEILKRDVFLTEMLAASSRQRMRHLDCIAFVRPSGESIDLLASELREPKYGKYQLVFCNEVRKSQLERLAQADEFEVVVGVYEYYLDFLQINRDFFSCGLKHAFLQQSERAIRQWDAEALEQCSSELAAVCASLRLRSPAVRYDANSGLSRQLAEQLAGEHAFSGAAGSPDGLVLVLDRLNDPVTPLLSHWTYQAMVDELVGIRNNCVDLNDSPDVPPSDRQMTLSMENDPFFKDTMYLNLGDLGSVVREKVQQFSSKFKSSQQLETVADMKQAVYELPELERQKGSLSKHVVLVGELQRLISQGQRLEMSEIEQQLACNENHAGDLAMIRERVLPNNNVVMVQKYAIVALYGLRYRRHPHQQTESLLSELAGLEAGNPTASTLDLEVRRLLSCYQSNTFPQEDLFNQSSFLVRAQQGLKGLRGVENVYTMHRSLLEQQLLQLERGKLPIERYPFIKGGSPQVKNVIVFMVGGATMEEARAVAEFNKNHQLKVVLGGSNSINQRQFLDSMR